MSARHAFTLAVVLSVTALTGACTEQQKQSEKPEPRDVASSAPATASPAASWEGKEDQEDAMRRATRALTAVEPDGASRVDEGMAGLERGLTKTFTAKGGRPYTFDVACQAPAAHSITLTLQRGESQSEYEVECGDREADQFNIPAGAPFAVRIAPAQRGTDGMILWRLNTIAPADVDDCNDDIQGCQAH
ncbi:hypothetical protein [Streptomyces kebangsaanensis]|uniref:hypothetical protein n=1 Tax=Streptomyces kebangsaanensis TaxID=864058 RepID=UPI00093CEA4D|nr:hypothetical protein [Streptomyces kebangsaanensis]